MRFKWLFVSIKTKLFIFFKRRIALNCLAFMLATLGSYSFCFRQVPPHEYIRVGANPKDYVYLPFALIHGVPVVDLTVNGNPHQFFIIDSGLEKSVLDLDAAKRLKIKISSDTTRLVVRGTGDIESLPTSITNKVKIQYKNQRILTGIVPAIQLDVINRLSPKPISGILGYDVISTHPIAIDYQREIITIFGGGSFEVPSTLIPIKLNSAHNIPVIRTRFNFHDGEIFEGRLLIDTGSQFGLEINRPFGEKNNLYGLRGWVKSDQFGIGGQHSALHGIPGELLLGNDKVNLDDIFLTGAEKGQTTVDSFDCSIGGAILDKYVVIFDVPHGQIFLDPNR